MKHLPLMELTFKAWITAGVPTKDIVCALHNACAHGSAMIAAGDNVNNTDLGKLFEGFDMCLEATESMSS